MSRSVLTKLQKHLVDDELDALVCLSPENVAYAAGFVIPSHALMRWRHAASVVTADGREAIVCVDMEETTVRQHRPDAEVRVWPEFTGDAMHTLAALLEDLGLREGRIGIELGYLSVADHGRLRDRMPAVTMVPAEPLLIRARRTKTSDELDLLTRLSRISDRAIKAALESVRAGDSEMDIAAALTRHVYEQGAQTFKLLIVATGERSELPNVGPVHRTLVPGDVCRVEIFAVADGYQAGVCRTAVVGEPPPQAGPIYRNLADCKQVLLEAIRPGVPARDIYRLYRRTFDELKLAPIEFVGHSIGVDLHEPPYLGPHDTDELEPGMVFGIEPLVYRTGHGFGMQIKDMVAVTDAGCELLSDVTDTSSPVQVQA